MNPSNHYIERGKVKFLPDYELVEYVTRRDYRKFPAGTKVKAQRQGNSIILQFPDNSITVLPKAILAGIECDESDIAELGTFLFDSSLPDDLKSRAVMLEEYLSKQ